MKIGQKIPSSGQKSEEREWVAVLDFGSQYTQLIARRARELGVYSRIFPPPVDLSQVCNPGLRGIILSGGPSSIYERGAPTLSPAVLTTGLPILGICYGLHLLGLAFGGKIYRAVKREYGRARLEIKQRGKLLKGIREGSLVWMSHGDYLTNLPPGFKALACTLNTPYATIEARDKSVYGVQFHPEVVHTRQGKRILGNFLYEICGCSGGWTPKSFISEAIGRIKDRVKGGKVVCGVSGGVDSTVMALLLNRSLGERAILLMVENGLLRKGEKVEVLDILSSLGLRVKLVRAKGLFLRRLKGVEDPEEKRRLIGQSFVEVFEKEAAQRGADFLAQGTLYPDLVESRSAFGGPSAVIKSHHNVGGLPSRMRLKLIEPLRELFKDEVRAVGKELGVPEEVSLRHPFPGPGLAVRIIGQVTEERLRMLRAADYIFIEELKKSGFYPRVWQAFAVLLPLRSVGVMGDFRTYERTVALRAVTSRDGMTADWSRLPDDLLRTVSSRIINEVNGVNRVVYDISSKPPSTIEWE